ncbi:uncharacterized protein LOC126738689 [Anthonomus grandis grandis]|uniref:uncharacterized protein LOC126738689 n=1 Tax=Anthonomus grandis grandis TaxID=2921223 RepID=UPI0021657C94|nr:uncharacterized protein LOC126738689 [Anthonomus grandis grandis]
MVLKRLLDLSAEDQKNFLDSFDIIFTDVDGVIWDLWYRPIEGATDAIKALRNIGKKIYFVTNNSTAPMEVFLGRLKKFEAVDEEVVRPANAFIWYLDHINFDKSKGVYVVGFQALKDQIARAGYKVVTEKIGFTHETLEALQEKLNNVEPNVGAVVLDFVVNVDYMGLQKCVQYIQRNNAIFLTGSTDPIVPYRGSNLIGSFHLAKAIEEVTNVVPKVLSKPGKEFHEVLSKYLGSLYPKDPKRILFIGDSVDTDMPFAEEYGYQKLLTLSGYTKKEHLDNWKWNEELRPDYFIDSLNDLFTVIKTLELNIKPKM